MKKWKPMTLVLATLWLGFAASAFAADPALKGTVTHYTISEWTSIDALKPFYSRLETELEAANPGLEVKVLSDPFMTWLDKYQMMLAANTAPDVVLVGVADLPKLANAGYLLDLGASFDAAYLKDFVPGILRNYTWKGKQYALPYTMDTRILYYNKDLFRKAGLDPEKPPKTWAEYLDYAKKLTMDTNGDGKIDTYGNAYDLPIPEFVMSSLFLASGGDLVKVDNKGVVTPNADTPEFRDYLRLLIELKKYSPPDFITLEGGADDQLFANGKLGMRINGSWLLDQNPQVKTAAWLGQGLIPKRKATDVGGSFGAGFGLAIPAKDKNPQAALALLRKIMTPEMHGNLITNPPPKYANLAASPWSKDPIHALELEQFKTTRGAFPNNLYVDKLHRAEQDIVTKVLLGALTVDQAVIELTKAINKIASQQ